ncbi:MAG: hypothetical protein EHJ95_04605 [Methanobacteriota archaeon]|nr:MAG: hypothetical protein EHJ95_04605 [Euryarchaeota archaeon]
MVMIVKQENAWAPFAQGLAQGLERYGQIYQQNQQKGRLAKAFESMGYDKEQAQAMTEMPEHLQQEFVKVKAKAPQQAALQALAQKYGMQEPQQNIQQSQQAPQEMSAIDLMQQATQQAQTPSPKEDLTTQLSLLAKQQRQDLMNRMIGGQQPQFGQPQMGPQMQGLQGLMGGMQGMPQAMDQDLLQRAAAMQYPEPQAAPQEVPQAPRDMAQVAPEVAAPSQVARETAKKPSADEMRADALQLAAMGTPDAVAMSKVLTKKADAQEARAQKAWDRADKKVTEYVDKERASEDQLDLINQMKELDKTGKLDSPSRAVFASMVDKVTGIEGAGNGLLTGDSQLFNKMRASFLKGLSKEFGGKVAIQEMDSFMKKFPSLMNSKEGRAKIYRMFEIAHDMANIDVKAAQDVIDNNGGYPPDNFTLEHQKRARILRKELTDSRAAEVNSLIASEQPSSSQQTTKSSALSVAKVPEGRVVYTASGKAMKKVNGVMVPA